MKRPSSASGRLGVKIVGGLKEVSAKKSSKGLNQWQMVESFVLLSSSGGECIDDMQRLRDDEVLAAIIAPGRRRITLLSVRSG